MTSLTFYGGVGEIGGNKILLEDGDTKIFLDFGMSFGRSGTYYRGYLNPRSAAGIRDHLRVGLLPDIGGLYRADILRASGIQKSDTDIDAVLLSHAHGDHANYIAYLDESIPVHMGETCRTLLTAISDAGKKGEASDVLEFKEAGASRTDPPVQRHVETFRTGKKFTINSVEVEPVHVDHSIPGAYGFLIHTSSGTVVYTGDLRFHGSKPEMTREFVEKAAASRPVALVTEGTRIDKPPTNESEGKVYTDCLKTVSGTKRLVMADFGIKDVDRLRTFYRIAGDTGRKFVVDASDAVFLKHFSSDPKLGIPPPDDANIAIHISKKKTYGKTEKEYIQQANAIHAEDIAKDEGKYLCALGLYNFGTLVDIKPDPGAIYIHSSSEPYSDDGLLQDEIIENWVDLFGMSRIQSHCSGHAQAADILSLVKTVDAKNVFPIHTDAPSKFGSCKNVTLVEERKRYDIT